jgi:hypothetical protein
MTPSSTFAAIAAIPTDTTLEDARVGKLKS